jgi:choice-of-anchor B domain-containing protein
MRSLLLCLAFFMVGRLAAQDSLNMHQVFSWVDDTLPDAVMGGQVFSYAGGWGMAYNGREYAVMGSSAYIHFFDVTDPAQSVEIGRFAGGDTSVWREFKNYQQYFYAVSDNTEEGMYVFDMSQAPDTVLLVKHDTVTIKRSHTLFIDEPNKRLYLTGTNTMAPGVVVMSLDNPADPTLLASKQLPGGYIHDSYCRDNILYANSGFSGLWVYDMTDPQNPVVLANTTTNGYCHSSWMNDAGNLLVNCDEVPGGLPVQLFDVSNISNNELELLKNFRQSLSAEGPGDVDYPTYHNPYFVGDSFVVIASYKDGLTIFNVADPQNPVMAAYYDTYPDNSDYVGYPYRGAWGAYPYLPSGRILVFDIKYGLIIIETDFALNNRDVYNTAFTVWPNPTDGLLHVSLPVGYTAYSFEVTSLMGQRVAQGVLTDQRLDLSALPMGMYVLHIRAGNRVFMSRVMVHG